MTLRKRNFLSRSYVLALFIGSQIISVGYTRQSDSQLAYEGFLGSRDPSIWASPNQELHHDAAAVVKLVPVRVLGPDGRPVRGLKKEDFVVYDNGQRQVITEFEIHEPPGISTPSESGARETGILKEVNRKYFFVMDMQGSDRLGNEKAKIAVLAFASANIQPGDEVCLLTFGATTGLVLRQYLTADLDKITKAVDHSIEMGSVAGMPQTDVIEVPTDYVDVQSGGVDEVTGRAVGGQKAIVLNPARPAEGESTNRIVVPGWGGIGRSYADFDMSMSELAKALAYIPGSKIVVYFSTRIPNRSVSRLFADANSTIFAVNTNSVPAKGGGADAGIRRRQKADQGHALAEFAEASGGRYFDDVAAADAIARDVTELAGHYYVLGYYVHPSWDGRAHEIRVETSTPGLRVMAQSGYYDPKPFAQWTDIEKQLHLFDLALSDRPVRAEFLDLPLEILCRSTAIEANTAILAKLQVDKMSGLPPGSTEAYIFVFDSNHQIAATWRGKLDTAALKTKKLFPYVMTRLPPGRYECRFVFREMESGRSAAVRRQFVVPGSLAAKPGPVICGPPLLLQEDEGEFVRLSKSEGKSHRRESLMSFYPFWPRNCFPLIGPCEQSEIRALLPILSTDGFNPEKDIAVELLKETEENPTPLEWHIIDVRRTETKMIYCFLRIGIKNQDHFCIKFTVTNALTRAQDSVTVMR